MGSLPRAEVIERVETVGCAMEGKKELILHASLGRAQS